jgi:hypothetical protein
MVDRKPVYKQPSEWKIAENYFATAGIFASPRCIANTTRIRAGCETMWRLMCPFIVDPGYLSFCQDRNI